MDKLYAFCIDNCRKYEPSTVSVQTLGESEAKTVISGCIYYNDCRNAFYDKKRKELQMNENIKLGEYSYFVDFGDGKKELGKVEKFEAKYDFKNPIKLSMKEKIIRWLKRFFGIRPYR